ncbi:hypothetical protein [Novipirellula galeiformis]
MINGRVRQACSGLVDSLLAQQPKAIERRPISKSPVVRNLFVAPPRESFTPWINCVAECPWMATTTWAQSRCNRPNSKSNRIR